ncbi:hypothetical protein [Wukongibacter sp. M2B1]|uniref:hypothetical protein n=1 Tax=Wukongibacter sp. M2B1 TaxID=3088895 RepID=UPI003D78BE65
MRKVKSTCVIMFFIGIVFCIYGWFQQVLEKPAKTYAFFVSGVILIYIAYVIDSFINEFKEEQKRFIDRIDELERIVKSINK